MGQDKETESTSQEIEADVKIVLPEDQTESTAATSGDGINFDEATIPAIIEDDEFGMKLDETTTVSGTTDIDEEDEVKEDETTPDSSIIFPLPQNPETTTTMQMTDDMAAT